MNQERSVRRRVHRSADERQALLSAWEASGLSARAFAKREGVRTSCLWRWRRAAGSNLSKAREGTPSRAVITFAPVHVAKAEAKTVLSAERTIAEVVFGRVCVRVLDGADMTQVSLLVRALAGVSSC
jgi:hypothetical protein